MPFVLVFFLLAEAMHQLQLQLCDTPGWPSFLWLMLLLHVVVATVDTTAAAGLARLHDGLLDRSSLSIEML